MVYYVQEAMVATDTGYYDSSSEWAIQVRKMSEEKYELDLQSKLVYAKREGEKRGREEGCKEGEQEIINLLRSVKSPETLLDIIRDRTERERLENEYNEYQRDLQRKMAYAERLGEEEGREEGRKEGEKRIVDLLKSGKPLEEVLKEYGGN